MIHLKKTYIPNKKKVIIIMLLLLLIIISVPLIKVIQFLYFYQIGDKSFTINKIFKNSNSIVIDLDFKDSCGFIQRYTAYQKDDETLCVTLYKDVFKSHPEFFCRGGSNYNITIDNLDDNKIQQIETVQIIQNGYVMEFNVA